MSLELRHLQQFIALAEELHFTRAADRMHVTQPTLTSQIKHLEGELGLTLFERSTRSVALTLAGERLLVKARAVTAAFDEVFATAASMRQGTSGRLTLGLPTRLRSAMRYEIGQLLAREAPAITLDFAIENNVRLMERVVNGDLDAAICFGPIVGEGLRTRLLTNDHAVVVMLATHPLAGRRTVSLHELVDDTLIIPSERFVTVNAHIENWFLGAGLQRKVAPVHWDYDETHAAVIQGLGVEISPSLLTNRAASTAIAVVQVEETDIMDAPVFIATRAENADPAVATLIETVALYFRRSVRR
jgi:DNA-binding transcriptional LysR family regulator